VGETELRGFEDPVKVWELRGQDDNETLSLCIRPNPSSICIC